MDFDATLMFIRTEVEKQLQGRVSVQDGYLEEFVSEHSGISSMLSEEIRNKLVRHLQTIFWTSQEDGHSLVSDLKPWYKERIQSDEFESYYWRRLEKYWYDHSILPKDSIRSTNRVTDEIMDFIGDPQDLESWKRSGLVMGHVQSGKTTNYSALITKAADAGYSIIIVLAGLTNSLRKQTQKRLDETFVGKSSLGDEFNIEVYSVSRVFVGMEGESKVPKHPYCGTTQKKDFSIEMTRGVGASEGNFADPILFVTKKHEAVLLRLAEWLSGLQQGGPLEGAMLLIDDEADNASVNTSKENNKVTRINQRVREVLKCSRRSSYVGYTATPFANIFIHPDSNDEMLKEDLFPRHFIKSLDPPDNYIGARELFSEGGRLVDICVHDIPDDFKDILPLKHKSDLRVEELPQSLIAAIFEYFLFRAVRILDNETSSHSSMMINVSRFNNVQRQINDLVEDLNKSVLDASNVWGKSSSWNRSEILQKLKNVWDAQYEPYSKYSWDEVRQTLSSAVSPIEVRLVNMQGSGLDYSERKDTPLHVIAIGGLALARGLTIEGLAVSYVLRNVGAADTLLQMGRWFGYRPGYEEFCRIHLTSEMREHFQHISTSVEELRDDLVRMEKMKRTPDEFGLKVRESPTGIAITAANKMRSAKPVYLAIDYSLRHVQAFELFDDAAINKGNLEAVKFFYQDLMNEYGDSFSDQKGAFVWKEVDARMIMSLLAKLGLPGLNFAHMNDGRSLISNYISDRADKKDELDKWVVAIPYTMKASGQRIARIKFPLNVENRGDLYCRQRISGERKDSDERIVKVTGKNVVADLPENDLLYGEDEHQLMQKVEQIRRQEEDISLEKAILSCRGKPLLIIHYFQFGLKTRTDTPEPEPVSFEKDLPVVSLSLGFTGTDIEPQEHQYAASVRLMEQMKLQLDEYESDDTVEDDD